MIVPVLALFQELFNRVFLSNSLKGWLTAAITTVVLFLVLYLARRVTVSRLGALAARTTNYVDDMLVDVIAHTRKWVMLAMSVIVGFGTLELGRVGQFFAPAAKLLVLWQIAIWGGAAIGFWVKHHLDKRTSVAERGGVAMINAMGISAKVVLWILIVITAFHSVFAINVAPWITGLGVGGIAVALAVQNILGDLLAALAIVFDKPFDVGDTIGIDQITGTVEHIGLKTTRLRSLSGEQVIIGNSDLLKSRLRNYRRMYQRRVLFVIDVTYDTPHATLARIPDLIKSIVTAQSPVKLDRSHVSSFGESAIKIETVYYVLDPDYAKYMDIQQAIYLALIERFAAENIAFAFPSRTIYLETTTGP